MSYVFRVRHTSEGGKWICATGQKEESLKKLQVIKDPSKKSLGLHIVLFYERAVRVIKPGVVSLRKVQKTFSLKRGEARIKNK